MAILTELSFSNVKAEGTASTGGASGGGGGGTSTNNYVDAASFSTADGILTLSRLGLSDVTVDLDGRYADLTGATFTGAITATSIIMAGGTSSQFLKADGTIDSSSYLTTADLSGYLLNTTDTFTGTLDVVGALDVTGTITTTSNVTLGGQTYHRNADYWGASNDYGQITWSSGDSEFRIFSKTGRTLGIGANESFSDLQIDINGNISIPNGNLDVTGTGAFSDVLSANNGLDIRSTSVVSTDLRIFPNGVNANATIRIMTDTGAANWDIGNGSTPEPLVIYNYTTANIPFSLNRTTDKLSLSDDLGVGGSLGVTGTITASGILSVDGTTQSTSTTTGSIHTDGGLGVAKDSFFGGDMDVSGDVLAGSGVQFKIGTHSNTFGSVIYRAAGGNEVLYSDTTSTILGSEATTVFRIANVDKMTITPTGVSVTGTLTATGAVTGSNLSGTNTGDQTSIVGITGTVAEFNTALTDGTFVTSVDLSGYLLNTTDTFTGTLDIVGALDVTGKGAFSGGLQVTGFTAPSSGSGAEIVYSGGNAYFQGYDRAGSIWLPVVARGSSVSLAHEASVKLVTTSTGINVTGTLTASDILSVDDTTQSTSTVTGSIHTDGGLGVAKDVFIGGNTYATNSITLSGATPRLYLTPSTGGFSEIRAGDSTDTDAGELQYSNTTESWSFKANALSALVISSTQVDVTGVLSVDDTTQSTSTITGSIHTDGGIGVAKDSFFGGDMDVSGDVLAGSGVQFKIGTHSNTFGSVIYREAGGNEVLYSDTTSTILGSETLTVFRIANVDKMTIVPAGVSVTGTLTATGNISAASFIKSGGTSSQFLKADGTVDSGSYALLSGATFTGGVTATSLAITGGDSDEFLMADGSVSTVGVGTPNVPVFSNFNSYNTGGTVFEAKSTTGISLSATEDYLVEVSVIYRTDAAFLVNATLTSTTVFANISTSNSSSLGLKHVTNNSISPEWQRVTWSMRINNISTTTSYYVWIHKDGAASGNAYCYPIPSTTRTLGVDKGYVKITKIS